MNRLGDLQKDTSSQYEVQIKEEKPASAEGEMDAVKSVWLTNKRTGKVFRVCVWKDAPTVVTFGHISSIPIQAQPSSYHPQKALSALIRTKGRLSLLHTAMTQTDVTP